MKGEIVMSLFKRLEEQKKVELPIQGKDKGRTISAVKIDPFQNLKGRIHKRIVDEMSLEESKGLTDKNVDKKILEDFVARVSNVVMDEEAVPVMRGDRSRVSDPTLPVSSRFFTQIPSIFTDTVRRPIEGLTVSDV